MTARTALPITALVGDAGADIPAGTVIDQTNGMSIAFSFTAIPAKPYADRLILLVETTNGADKTVTIKAGANPPAFRQGLGDLVVTAHAATGGAIIGPFESARYVQADGSVNIDFASGIAGRITAITLPRAW